MADERDPDISRKYRELGAEEPPRALDDAILAASRRAVDSHPAPLVVPAGRRRWYFPVAAAAMITLAVAVTVQVERQKPDDEIVVATAPPQAKEERAAAQVEKKEQAFSGPAAEQPKPAQKAMRAPQPFTPESPAAPAGQKADAMQDLAKSTEQAAGAAGAPPPVVAQAAPAPAPEPARREMEAQRPQASVMARGKLESKTAETPETALERIAELRKQGKHEEADKALAEFRKQYPDYRMPDEMKAKVERK